MKTSECKYSLPQRLLGYACALGMVAAYAYIIYEMVKSFYV